ncbi:MAG: phage morphogenesis protein [Pseudomonadota bacterium]
MTEASQSLTWKGDGITARFRQAQIIGVNVTMSECVQHAKDNHSWQNRSGTLEGSLNIVDFAKAVPGGVVGRWGSQDVVYALIHELGGVIVPTKAKALAIPQPDGSVRFASKVTIRAQPYLRPAADAKYPNLPGNIRKAYERLGAQAGDAPPGGA